MFKRADGTLVNVNKRNFQFHMDAAFAINGAYQEPRERLAKFKKETGLRDYQPHIDPSNKIYSGERTSYRDAKEQLQTYLKHRPENEEQIKKALESIHKLMVLTNAPVRCRFDDAFTYGVDPRFPETEVLNDGKRKQRLEIIKQTLLDRATQEKIKEIEVKSIFQSIDDKAANTMDSWVESCVYILHRQLVKVELLLRIEVIELEEEIEEMIGKMDVSEQLECYFLEEQSNSANIKSEDMQF